MKNNLKSFVIFISFIIISVALISCDKDSGGRSGDSGGRSGDSGGSADCGDRFNLRTDCQAYQDGLGDFSWSGSTRLGTLVNQDIYRSFLEDNQRCWGDVDCGQVDEYITLTLNTSGTHETSDFTVTLDIKNHNTGNKEAHRQFKYTGRFCDDGPRGVLSMRPFSSCRANRNINRRDFRNNQFNNNQQFMNQNFNLNQNAQYFLVEIYRNVMERGNMLVYIYYKGIPFHSIDLSPN